MIRNILDVEALSFWNAKSTDADLMDRFELNGKIYFERNVFDDDEFIFYLGPSIDNGLSDALSINGYLSSVLSRLNISNVDLSVSENCHAITGLNNESDAEPILNSIINLIRVDGFEVEEDRN